jgi:hypothetical protein
MAYYNDLGNAFAKSFGWEVAAKEAEAQGAGRLTESAVKWRERENLIRTLFGSGILINEFIKDYRRGKAIGKYAESEGYVPVDKKWWDIFSEKEYERGGKRYTQEDINVRRMMGVDKSNEAIYGLNEQEYAKNYYNEEATEFDASIYSDYLKKDNISSFDEDYNNVKKLLGL